MPATQVSGSSHRGSLRHPGGDALPIAALAADGTSTIRGMFRLRRGYGHLLANLTTLGADIIHIPEAP
ncbi:hypothetical protein [Streptomyces sp. NPDC003077]|uniref:hypothetical protein n=1 Tax=Streptomyces sp. NPDC003077 TaxID=3154443 RepID=UPI0033AC5672